MKAILTKYLTRLWTMLSIVMVTLHELCHYLAAKLMGIKVVSVMWAKEEQGCVHGNVIVNIENLTVNGKLPRLAALRVMVVNIAPIILIIPLVYIACYAIYKGCISAINDVFPIGYTAILWFTALAYAAGIKLSAQDIQNFKISVGCALGKFEIVVDNEPIER